MTRFLARRLLNYVVLLGLASFLTFSLTSLTFEPLDSLLRTQPAPAAGRHRRQGRRTQPRQADPAALRATGSPGAVRGDFGTTVSGQPVTDELWRRIGVSLRLVIIGSVVGTVLGVVVGAWGAIRQYRLSDRVITSLSLLILSTPTFVIANLLILAALQGELDPRDAGVRVHRRDIARRRRRRVEPVRRPAAASGAAHAHAGAGRDRRVQPLSAQRDARRAGPGLHPHRAGQGTDPAAGAVQARPAHRADPDGHAVRLRGRRAGHRARCSSRRSSAGTASANGSCRASPPRTPTSSSRSPCSPGATVLLAGLLSDVLYAALDPRVRVR